MSAKLNSIKDEPINLLVEKNRTSPKKTQQFYEKQKLKKMSFGQVWGPESHLRRRKFILEDHPQIAKLLVADKPYSIILTVILVFINILVSYLVKDSSWLVIFTTVYIVGGTLNHTLHVLIHDFTHWAGHPNILVNKIFAIFCNISMGLPSAIGFGIYHADHHNYLGQQDKDPDLPSLLQVKFVSNKYLKTLFFLLLSPIYALRPFIFMHKRMTQGEIINFILVFCSDLLILKFWGGGALAYILAGGFLSIGAHPAAIHVIAEHAEFVKGLQTYDYLGVWNILNLNLGYHIEHHDFPTCPWYNLPKVRLAAKQYYQQLPYHTSYLSCLYKFIFDQNFSLFNRTVRVPYQEVQKKQKAQKSQ